MHCLQYLAGLTAVLWIPGDSAEQTTVVQTSYGPIQGEEVTYEGTNYKAFKGIPYAAPPVGELRFAAPQPPQKWTDVREATKYGKICPQEEEAEAPPTDEDCLTLNVFTPSLDESHLKPVVFWIHGGGFISGDGTDVVYGPQYLIKEDIVIVTINYRLGALGFLSANTPAVSGNWGLKDQVAALKWVQENIAHFGGDPKQVTIYGESAGGISVHLHLFSPLSKGLFSKAISSSGSALAFMGQRLKTQEKSAKYSKNLARVLEAPEADIDDPMKRVEFLRKVEANKIIEQNHEEVTDEEDLKNPLFDAVPFLPVIETPGTEGAFLTECPKKSLEGGRFTKVPLMMGLNSLEGGIMLLGLGKEITPESMKGAEENICNALPGCLKKAVTERKECPQVAKEMSKTYFDGKPFDSSMLNFIQMCGDIAFVVNVYQAQRLHARVTKQNPPVYSYYFTFDGDWNLAKMLYNISLPGASHGDDLSYVFKPSIPLDESPTSPEVITRNRMVRLIANFVKHGNPTPAVSDLIPVKWEPATENEPVNLVIDNDLKLEKEFLKTRMDMWDRFYKEYTGKPLFT